MCFYSTELAYQRDASSYYAAIADMPWAIWLDSGGMARYDILTALPRSTLRQAASATGDPFALLRKELGATVKPVENVPFAGGALGVWGYDLARPVFGEPGNARDAEQQSEMAIGIYDWAVILDHQQHTARLVSHQRYPETAQLLPQILRRLQQGKTVPRDKFRVQGKITSNFTPERYSRAFASVKNYLKAGDCYQINLAQRFSAAASGDALGAYLALRRGSPAPYSAFLNLPDSQILCASPECFLRVRNGMVETRPIKGTRPRSSDIQQDVRLAAELQNHPKDRAENLMIVDLLRNDLGKCCEAGSVRVAKLFGIESFSNVHHLVSTVEGKLAAGRDAIDLLRDCFPGGSVTGAPKLRAMQIIEQLEPDRRGIYCGTIGYVGFDGNMDSNIVIRTLVYSNDEVRCWAGGGIVADSELAAEYRETLDKASAMLDLLRNYGGEYEDTAQIG
ncbi:MAG: aminodeoxychorismate synthase component I [Gallionella sp.]